MSMQATTLNVANYFTHVWKNWEKTALKFFSCLPTKPLFVSFILVNQKGGA